MEDETGKLRCKFPCFSRFGSRLFLLEGGVRTTIPDRGKSRVNWVRRVALDWNLGVGLVLGQLRMNVLIVSAMTWKKRGNPPHGCVFTASRGTFAFAAESPGLSSTLHRHFSPSLSSVLKSQRLREKGASRERNTEQRGRGRRGGSEKENTSGAFTFVRS